MSTDQRLNFRKILQNRLGQLRRLLTMPHPTVQEVGERRRAELLAIISIILTGLLFPAASFVMLSDFRLIVLLVITLLSYVLSRSQFYNLGSYFLSFGFTSLPYILLFLGIAVDFSATITTFAHTALITASLLLPARGFVALVALAITATISAPYYARFPISADELVAVASVFTTLGLILAGSNIFRSWIENARLHTLKNTNDELEILANHLEDRVQQRTRALHVTSELTARRAAQLQTIAELSQAIARVQSPVEIFPTAVRLISGQFGFYHVGIFLVDDKREFAVLQASNSEGGQKMLARGHRLEFGTGVVGFAALTGKPRIALDVGTDAVFFNNPDLPETRSEIALPLLIGGATIGVLDVQSTEAKAFTEDDYQVLGILANQLAISLENARLLNEARASAAQVQEVYSEFIRTEWSRAASTAEQAGFRYYAGRIEILETPLQNPTITSAVRDGKLKTKSTGGLAENPTLAAIPVKLRGEVIGVMQIESNDPTHAWKEEELSLMEAVAERAALALENARLFHDARRRAAKEHLISESTARISNSLNVENILKTTAEELGRVLGGSEVLIRFQNGESK